MILSEYVKDIQELREDLHTNDYAESASRGMSLAPKETVLACQCNCPGRKKAHLGVWDTEDTSESQALAFKMITWPAGRIFMLSGVSLLLGIGVWIILREVSPDLLMGVFKAQPT